MVNLIFSLLRAQFVRTTVFVVVFWLCGTTLFISCNNDYTPKPRGYFRIALPDRKYTLLDSVFPYKFEYPSYAHITNDPLSPQERNWMNIEMPVFRGRIHISYKPIANKTDLTKYTEDARALALKHMAKASGIEQIAISNPVHRVYGLVYQIKGLGAASPYQFYLTDSIKHFIRGSLYFDVIPNNDSLAPVIDFVQKDIQHLIETTRWK